MRRKENGSNRPSTGLVSKAGREGNFFAYIVNFDYINTNSLNLLDIRKGEKMKTKKIIKNSMIIIIVILYMAIGYIIIMNCQMEKMVTKEIGGLIRDTRHS